MNKLVLVCGILSILVIAILIGINYSTETDYSGEYILGIDDTIILEDYEITLKEIDINRHNNEIKLEVVKK